MIFAQTSLHATGKSAFASPARAIDAHGHHQTPTQAVREFRGLTQADLARRADVSLGTIVALENGQRPDTLLLGSVAAALEVPMSQLERGASAPEDLTQEVS
jgi:DNA-binding XRE family transcriptional regulator